MTLRPSFKIPLTILFSISLASGQDAPKKEEPHPAIKALVTWAKALKVGNVKPGQQIFRPQDLAVLKVKSGNGNRFEREMMEMTLKDQEKFTFKTYDEDKASGVVMLKDRPILPMGLKGDRWMYDADGVPRIIREARISTAKIEMQTFTSALESYKINGGTYPTNEQGLTSLYQKPTTPPKPRRWVQFVKKPEGLNDPWGNPYQYKFVDGEPVLTSLGPDGKISEDDITSK